MKTIKFKAGKSVKLYSDVYYHINLLPYIFVKITFYSVVIQAGWIIWDIGVMIKDEDKQIKIFEDDNSRTE
jgi:hypothetical protein